MIDLAELDRDRVAMTCRPLGRGVMRQNWNDLLFLHWIVPPDQLAPLLPPGLELDTFEGRAYVGLVPFTMTGVRPIWAPAVRALSDFHETNVRTYVHRRGRAPGVWFFSLDAANAAAVRIARAWFKLPYHYARMSLRHEEDRGNGTGSTAAISYASERLWPPPTPAACRVRCRPDGPVQPATVGTLEHFLAERYLLYAACGTRLYSGRVHHAPYPLQTARVDALDETLVAAAGIRRPDTAPLAHYARGVQVHVFPLREVLT
jgi:uncharacterized protein YqjF (DUF2071 family)